jgi:hypothetical protein
LVAVASQVPAGLTLISAILKTSPATLTAVPEIAAVVAADNVKAVDDVIRATTVLAGIAAAVIGEPTTIPDIDDTDVTLVAADAADAVGVTVILKLCPPENNSLLKLVDIAVDIAINLLH